MATFPKGHSSRSVLVLRVKVVSVATIPEAKITWMLTASDTLTLRGIPAIGRGVQGVIRGTKPGTLQSPAVAWRTPRYEFVPGVHHSQIIG